MKLLTKELLATLPALYTTENIKTDEKMVMLKFFLFNFTWFVVEAEEQDNDVLFFGYVQNDAAPDCSEWGYFVLTELESLLIRGVFSVERDLYFRPTKFANIKND